MDIKPSATSGAAQEFHSDADFAPRVNDARGLRRRQSSERGLLHGPLNPHSRSRPQADGPARFQPGGPLPVRHLLE
jgi:hypothetical protein